MLYVTFQKDAYMDETTQPVDKNKLWVTTLQVGELKVTTALMLPATVISNMSNEKFSIPIYMFDTTPTIKEWSETIQDWEELDFSTSCRLMSSDNYVLKDSTGLYLVPKET
jgi:hypothetical protein